MIIRDKQDLRKCVKQCVRRAQVIETDAVLTMIQDEFGVEANLKYWAPEADSLQESFERASAGSPFGEKPFRLIAALDALQLPAHDLDKAEAIVKGYDRDAYLSGVLNAMRARKVLVRTTLSELEIRAFTDERFACMVAVDDSAFAPGRYGVDYERVAQQIAQAIHMSNASDVMLTCFSESALRYCMIPVCEDEHAVLHVCAVSEEQLNTLFDILNAHRGVRAIVNTSEHLERMLIGKAVSVPNVLVELRDVGNIPYALRTLGTRFIPYASCAYLPEDMLGGWIYAKEALWQAMHDAYLPLARAGYELTRERIEADVETLLCGNYEKIHEW